jgi:hypothetical protein
MFVTDQLMISTTNYNQKNTRVIRFEESNEEWLGVFVKSEESRLGRRITRRQRRFILRRWALPKSKLHPAHGSALFYNSVYL